MIRVRRQFVEHAGCNSYIFTIMTKDGWQDVIQDVDEYEERVIDYEIMSEKWSLFDEYE